MNSVAREVATAGRELTESLSGEQLFVVTERSRAGEGAGKVLLVDGGVEVEGDPDLIAEALARAATKKRPSAILLGATRTGRIVAARLAAKLRLGCLSNVYRLRVQGSSIVGYRDVFAGKVVAELKAELPCIATVKVGTYPVMSEGSTGLEVEEVGSLHGGVRLVKTLQKREATTDLRAASGDDNHDRFASTSARPPAASQTPTKTPAEPAGAIKSSRRRTRPAIPGALVGIAVVYFEGVRRSLPALDL